ncbi:MAG: cellulose biosynthesis cyclic di-GMP-binding regulatory protein BcsB [Eubacteriales bacterium]|nr:cellulose biosynthesis cyclic di-GMP-binding regulatory protein BcsB [Eubacteriales bacterium]
MKKCALRLAASLLSLLTVCLCAFPAMAAGNGEDVYEVGFSAEHNLTGLFSSFSESFHIGTWEVHEAELTLCFSPTPLARLEVSDFTLSLNDVRFYSARLPESTGQIFEVKIPVPAYLFNEGLNVLRMETYIRTNDGDPCEEDISDASWMTVLKDSSLTIRYTPVAQIQSVADCYRQFTSIDALDNELSAVCLPTAASNMELTAAGYILTGVAANATIDYNSIQLLEADSVDALRGMKYVFYVAEYARLLPQLASRLSEEQKQAAREGGVIALVELAPDCHVLVVTAEDPAALLNSARLFGNAAYMGQNLFTWRKVSATEDVTFDWSTETPLYAFTDTGTYLHGPFRQSMDYYIVNGADQMLSAGSEVSLQFRYSENLDFTRSLLTAYINDIPIGSTRLSRERAGGDMVRFDIPADIDVTGNFVLRVAFDLEIQDLICTIRMDNMPWAFVSPDSYVKIVSEPSPYLLFDYYPAPFVNNGVLNDLAVVIPDEPSETDLSVFADVLLTFGRYQKDNSGSLVVYHSAALGDISQKNVVSIGALSKNFIAQQINDRLYFRFSPGGTTLLSNEKMQIEPNYGALLGTGQILYSPYSGENDALLLITGTTDETIAKAATYLGDVDHVWQIAGDAFVTDGETVAYYRFKEDNSKTRSLWEQFKARKDLLVLTGIGLVIVVAMAITSIVLVARKKRGA